MTDALNICVYCGSSRGDSPGFAQSAQELGAAIAGAGHTLVYGGGHVGLMGVVADAVMEAGQPVIGVMTQQLVDSEVAHQQLTTLEILPDMHTRKARMAELADAIVVLPGGFGTLDETFELLTWNQLGLTRSPVVFLDVDNYFGSLFDFIDHTVASGFVKQTNADLAQRATTAAEAVHLASQPPADFTPKWIK